MFGDYDSWKTTPPSHLADDYANAKIDDMCTEEVVQKAVELGLCNNGAVYKIIEYALFVYYMNEFYEEK